MIKLVVPSVPPTTNHAYHDMVIKKKHGKGFTTKRILSKEGKKYKAETVAHLLRNYPAEFMLFKQNQPFGVAYQFVFLELENKTWPERTDIRYKKLDVTGRVKLVEDALVDASGLDDSHYFHAMLDKCEGYKRETRIWVWDMTQEGHLPDDVVRAIQGL